MYARMRLMALIFCIIALSVQWAGAQAEKTSDGLSLVVTSVDINDKTTELHYELINNSKEDFWILAETTIRPGISSSNIDVFMSEDNHTLIIRRRTLTYNLFMETLYRRYVCLRPGEKQTESILMNNPIRPFVLFKRTSRQNHGLEYATRLVIEIGFYSGDLPENALNWHIENAKQAIDHNDILETYSALGGRISNVLQFQFYNKKQDEEFVIPCYPWSLGYYDKDERVLKKVLENLHIPYIEETDLSVTHKIPNLSNCNKIEINFYPSILDYFFPYQSQQSLLSSNEKESLSSRTLFIKEAHEIESIASNINLAESLGGNVVSYRKSAIFICFADDKPLLSFPLYNDDIIFVEGKRFILFEGMPALRILKPQIGNIDLRIQCASTLKRLWYAIRFVYINIELRRSGRNSTNSFKIIYPKPLVWCDDLSESYPVLFGKAVINAHPIIHFICPATKGEGKSNYAMNPNCEPNSPGDMVLLFETRTGWNQHGGPELFTFNNHVPKGGCVLLNDGTVKFIRTEEELNDLRWK